MAVIKNNSKGYGYNYASLADIDRQGIEIPKMQTKLVEGIEFVFYYDKELNEWLQGAQIVIPEGKGMNKAQLYGSALSYARRYTTLMAAQLSCSDDALIENLNADGTRKDSKKVDEQEETQETSYRDKLTAMIQADCKDANEFKRKVAEIAKEYKLNSKSTENDFKNVYEWLGGE